MVMSLGALDMVNFGALSSVPPRFQGRRLHVHNAQVTLMRTTADENQQIARWIAGKLNRSSAPLRLLIPERGVSLLDAPGQPFHDPLADAALFDTLQAEVRQTDRRRVIRMPYHINDALFAASLVENFEQLRSQPSD